MPQTTPSILITPKPSTVDTIQLRDIQLHLPTAPDTWHRIGMPQPCTASLRFSYSSSIASAESDDVSRTIDYGKLFRRITHEIRNLGEEKLAGGYTLGNHIINVDGRSLQETLCGDIRQDIRLFAGIMARCCLEILDECAESCPQPKSISTDYAEFDIQLHLPKSHLRANGVLNHRSKFAIGTEQDQDATNRRLILLLEEFDIRQIRSYCILGINPWERCEKQAVDITLKFEGTGGQKYGLKVVETCQEMVRDVAERVEKTSFKSVEALASFVARIVTVDYGNEKVTVLVEKPNSLAFVGGSGLEVTRTRAFFD